MADDIDIKPLDQWPTTLFSAEEIREALRLAKRHEVPGRIALLALEQLLATKELLKEQVEACREVSRFGSGPESLRHRTLVLLSCVIDGSPKAARRSYQDLLTSIREDRQTVAGKSKEPANNRAAALIEQLLAAFDSSDGLTPELRAAARAYLAKNDPDAPGSDSA